MHAGDLVATVAILPAQIYFGSPCTKNCASQGLTVILQVLIQRILWNNLTICTFAVLKLEPTSLANWCRLEAKVFLTFATESAANPWQTFKH